MSGILNLLLAAKRTSPLSSGTITLTSGSADAPGGPQADRRHYGYSANIGIGSRSPTTFGGYTVNDLRETLEFASTTGVYTSPQSRKIYFELTGGSRPLTRGDLNYVQCPLGQVLQDTDATFTGAADGGQWEWTVATSTDSGFPTHLSNGSFIITV